MGPEMKEEQSWLLIQHVAVDRSHIYSVLPQRLDHGIHFVIGENEIAGDGSLAAVQG